MQFNSLHAQREKPEGWLLVPDRFGGDLDNSFFVLSKAGGIEFHKGSAFTDCT